MSAILIRKATPADARSIARLHAASWKTAYATILPREYLDNDLESEREKHWLGKMQNLAPDDFVLLAERNDTLIGFTAVWDTPGKDFPAIVDNLHVLPEEKGKGTGILLLCLVAAELQRQAKNSFYLWVYDQNVAALEFYKRAGGRPVGKNLYEVMGRKIPETKIGWSTLDGLLALLPKLAG